MERNLIFLICFFAGLQLFAQDYYAIDEKVFSDVVFSEPNPPKPIRGWELVESENDNAELIGEYPGRIIKFQFIGDAVGIEVSRITEAGMIEYSLDGAAWQTQDLFVPMSDEELSSLFFTLEENRKNRRHTLQIRLTDEKNEESLGKKCVIRNFYYNSPEKD